MELTLKRLLEQAKFTERKGGYVQGEVDDFLDRASAMAAKVEVQLTQALQAKAEAGPSPQDLAAEVERRVAERLAAQPVGQSEEDSAEEVRRTIILAQRTADAAVREAREDAEKLAADAREQAATLTADAQAAAEAMRADAEAASATLRSDAEAQAAALRAEGEANAARERREARQRLAGEIAELEGLREALRNDVVLLERHVEEQRDQLGSTVAELQRLLEDPSGFRLAPLPALADPELPDLSTDQPQSPEAVDHDAPPPGDSPAEDAGRDQVSVPAPEPTPAAPGPAASPFAGPAPIAAQDAPAPAPAPAPVRPFEAVDHEAPDGRGEPVESGPPTAPARIVDLGDNAQGPADRAAAPAAPGSGDDAFLAELRKAMSDDAPLGPRETVDQGPTGDPFLDDDDRRSWRFGRRR